MKKIVIILVMAIASINIYANDWDVIGDNIKNSDTIVDYVVSMAFVTKDVYKMKPIQFETGVYYEQELIKGRTVKIPKTLYDRYVMGENLMTAGWITMLVGGMLTISGGIMYNHWNQVGKSEFPNMGKASMAFMGVGGTLIGVSIPLLCFGDNAKREANATLGAFRFYF